MKKLLTYLSLVVLFFTSILTGVTAQATTIDKEAVVTIGFDNTFAPFGFEKDGKYTGFDIELAEEVLGRMNVDYDFQPIEWGMKETELNTGNIDMIWNGYSVTPEREKIVAFSDVYLENRQAIVVLEDSDIQTKEDLAGKVVATQEESASLEAINKDKKFADTLAEEPVTYASFVEVFQDLDNKRVDAIVVDETLTMYYMAQSDKDANYRILEDDFGREDYAVGFRKDDKEFIEEFNKVLKEVKEDGTFDKIKDKWFKSIN